MIDIGHKSLPIIIGPYEKVRRQLNETQWTRIDNFYSEVIVGKQDRLIFSNDLYFDNFSDLLQYMFEKIALVIEKNFCKFEAEGQEFGKVFSITRICNLFKDWKVSTIFEKENLLLKVRPTWEEILAS